MIPNDEVVIICNTLEKAGYSAYLVGGAVRDLCIGRTPKDWDIATSAKPEQIKALFSKTIDTGIKHGTVTVMLNNRGYEVTTYRVDGNYSDGRHPDTVEFTPSIDEDLARRDFTINTLALDIRGKLIDPFGGIADLNRGIIHCVGDPYRRFAEDALRMLRAFRFEAQFNFQISAGTKCAIKQSVDKLNSVSAERIRDELTKLLVADHPALALEDAYLLGVTKVILPEFDRMMECLHENKYHYTNVGRHCLAVVMGVPAMPTLRWAALLHDVGKPDTKAYDDTKGRYRYIGHPERSVEIASTILDRLKFSNADKNHILKLIQYHDYISDTPSKLRRFAAEMGKDFFPDFNALRYADAYAHAPEYAPYIQEKHDQMASKIQSYFDDGSAIGIHDLAITGNDLLEIGLSGKQIGDFLSRMLNECLGQPNLNNRQFLLAQAEKYKIHEDRKLKFGG